MTWLSVRTRSVPYLLLEDTLMNTPDPVVRQSQAPTNDATALADTVAAAELALALVRAEQRMAALEPLEASGQERAYLDACDEVVRLRCALRRHRGLPVSAAEERDALLVYESAGALLDRRLDTTE